MVLCKKDFWGHVCALGSETNENSQHGETIQNSQHSETNIPSEPSEPVNL